MIKNAKSYISSIYFKEDFILLIMMYIILIVCLCFVESLDVIYGNVIGMVISIYATKLYERFHKILEVKSEFVIMAAIFSIIESVIVIFVMSKYLNNRFNLLSLLIAVYIVLFITSKFIHQKENNGQ